MIGGNRTAIIQVIISKEQNLIGEKESEWIDIAFVKGFLDLSGGDSKYTVYSAKIQESTHIFICDCKAFIGLAGEWQWDPFCFENGVISNAKLGEKVDITSENARILIDNHVYDIMLIDDPMGLHHHFEIYLKYVGGQNG